MSSADNEIKNEINRIAKDFIGESMRNRKDFMLCEFKSELAAYELDYNRIEGIISRISSKYDRAYKDR